MASIKTYYQLTKPGIIYGNLLSAAAGFFIAAQKHPNASLLIETLVGIALVIASACVFNNYLDRGIDAKMARTKKRALVKGNVPPTAALAYASVLGVLGFVDLAVYVNWLTFGIGIIGFVDYVLLYGLTKRLSWHGTLVGSLSGSAPIVAGYTAVTNRFDGGALILFLILTFWQMPHFYAIALRRLKDYKAAGLPVLPAVRSAKAVKSQIVFFAAGFAASVAALAVFGYAGYFYLAVMGIYAASWLITCLKGFSAKDDTQWAKKVFLQSLIMLPLLFVVAPIDAWLR